MHIGTAPSNTLTAVYENLDLAALGPSKKAYEFALSGYESLKSSGQLIQDHILSVVDFSLPSNQKRLWVIRNNKVLVHCRVAHGKNSGEIITEH